jgi:SAM-dependent methyltransferase
MIDRPESQEYVAEVAAAYDAIGDDYYRYYRNEPSAVVEKYDRLILDGIVSGSSVLELGCGNGLPTTQKFARKFDVTTLDFSQKQIEKARQNVVGPRFLDADMSTVEFPEGSFDGVVAFYSTIHLPRNSQIGLFRSIFSWLQLGDLFVGTLAKSGEEIQVEKDWFGASMYWSSFDAETYRKLIIESGFVIELDVVETSDDPNSETEKEIHLWMVDRRPE